MWLHTISKHPADRRQRCHMPNGRRQTGSQKPIRPVSTCTVRPNLSHLLRPRLRLRLPPPRAGEREGERERPCRGGGLSNRDAWQRADWLPTASGERRRGAATAAGACRQAWRSLLQPQHRRHTGQITAVTKQGAAARSCKRAFAPSAPPAPSLLPRSYNAAALHDAQGGQAFNASEERGQAA